MNMNQSIIVEAWVVPRCNPPHPPSRSWNVNYALGWRWTEGERRHKLLRHTSEFLWICCNFFRSLFFSPLLWLDLLVGRLSPLSRSDNCSRCVFARCVFNHMCAECQVCCLSWGTSWVQKSGPSEWASVPLVTHTDGGWQAQDSPLVVKHTCPRSWAERGVLQAAADA